MSTIMTKPEREFKVGAVRATIWTNPRTKKTGEAFMSYRIQVERTYKDSHGNFQNTTSLETNDIPKAILALKKAFEYLTTRGGKDESERPTTDASKAPVRIP